MRRLGFAFFFANGLAGLLLQNAWAEKMVNDMANDMANSMANSMANTPSNQAEAAKATAPKAPSPPSIALPDNAMTAARQALKGTGITVPSQWRPLASNKSFRSYESLGPYPIRVDVPSAGFLYRISCPLKRIAHPLFTAEHAHLTAVWDDLRKVVQQRQWQFDQFATDHPALSITAEQLTLTQSHTLHGPMLEKATGRRRFQKLTFINAKVTTQDLAITAPPSTPEWSVSSLQQLNTRTSAPTTSTIRVNGSASVQHHGIPLVQINDASWHSHQVNQLLLSRLNADLHWPYLIGMPNELQATLQVQQPEQLVELLSRAASLPQFRKLAQLAPVKTAAYDLPLEQWVKELGIKASLDVRATAPSWFGQIDASINGDSPNVIAINHDLQITNKTVFNNNFAAKLLEQLRPNQAKPTLVKAPAKPKPKPTYQEPTPPAIKAASIGAR